MVGRKIHHFPSLFLHSSRRIRLVTASLHHYLLADALNRAEFISQLLGTDTQQSETLIGSWCLAACDLDRHVSREARKSFDEILTWPARSDSEAEPGKLNLSDLLATSLADFLAKTILNPSALYTLIYASPVIPANLPQLSDKHTSSTDGNTTPRRAEAEEETTEEMQSRFRIGALGGTKWFLG